MDIMRVDFAVKATAPGRAVALTITVGGTPIDLSYTPGQAVALAHLLLQGACDSIGPLRTPEDAAALMAPEYSIVQANALLRDALPDMRPS